MELENYKLKKELKERDDQVREQAASIQKLTCMLAETEKRLDRHGNQLESLFKGMGEIVKQQFEKSMDGVEANDE